MKIVVDVFGGDNAPKEIIKGATMALFEEQDFSIILVGKETEISPILSDMLYPKDRIEIINATEVITNEDSPVEALRKKANSSLVRSFDILNSDEDVQAFVSAGSTGAVLTGAVLLLKRIRGINRPGLAPLLPTINGDGQVLLIDCGANADPKPINLLQFAEMGSAFMKAVHHIPNPRIGLLSNGTEEGKGNMLSKEVYNLLKENDKINFVGNLEGRDILNGDFDVVVADGFSGNVALKSCEGTALGIFELIKQGIIKGGIRAKLGYLLLKPVFKKINKKMDYNQNGGAVLLGLRKIVIKAHGSSKAHSICASILQAKQMVDNNLVARFEELFI